MDKQDFDRLSDTKKLDALFDMVKEIQDKMGVPLTRDQRLQRKSMWSKKDVCYYFDITPKTFERWKASGEIKVKEIRGKDYCSIIDLKSRVMERDEDIGWLLKHMP